MPTNFETIKIKIQARKRGNLVNTVKGMYTSEAAAKPTAERKTRLPRSLEEQEMDFLEDHYSEPGSLEKKLSDPKDGYKYGQILERQLRRIRESNYTPGEFRNFVEKTRLTKDEKSHLIKRYESRFTFQKYLKGIKDRQTVEQLAADPHIMEALKHTDENYFREEINNHWNKENENLVVAQAWYDLKKKADGRKA